MKIFIIIAEQDKDRNCYWYCAHYNILVKIFGPSRFTRTSLIRPAYTWAECKTNIEHLFNKEKITYKIL